MIMLSIPCLPHFLSQSLELFDTLGRLLYKRLPFLRKALREIS